MGAPLFGEKPKWKLDVEGRKMTGLRGKTKEERKAIQAKRDPASYKTGSTKEGSSYFYNDLVEVRMPEFTSGICRKCNTYTEYLGDGHCVNCFDRIMEK